MVYNTSTHDGLKSHSLPSPLPTESSRPKSSLPSASDINKLSVSTYLSVTHKPLSESTAGQLSTEDKVTASTLKSGSLTNPSSIKDSLATLPQQPRSVSRELATSTSQSKTGRSVIERILQIFKAQTANAALQTLKGDGGPVFSVAFSPDSKLVASASETAVRLWDTATDALLQTHEDHRDAYSIAFSPDGKVVASTSWDTTVRLWDPAMVRLPYNQARTSRLPLNTVEETQY